MTVCERARRWKKQTEMLNKNRNRANPRHMETESGGGRCQTVVLICLMYDLLIQ